MSRRPSPAMLVLLEAGISLQDIATELDVTTAAVSYHLNGHTTDATPILEVLERIAGPEVAKRAAERITLSRTLRLEEADR